MKTLIVYGTRYGATAETSEEIARVLREESLGFDVKVMNAKEEKIKDISEYELIVVGSGLQLDKWTAEAEDFLKRFRKDLAQRKVAIFVSSAFVPLYRKQGKTAEVERARKKYLEEKAANYSLKPIAMEIFGGVLDFNKMGFLARKTLGWVKSSFEAAGYKETKPCVYDTRDWNEIKDWARKLILKARYL
jgi:menaquinone-dependent protoporphyrinogen oxidase